MRCFAQRAATDHLVIASAASSEIMKQKRKKKERERDEKSATEHKHTERRRQGNTKGKTSASSNRLNVTKDNRTWSEHSAAQHSTPEQAVIVLCGTDPSTSQQALHDEWAWR